MDKHSVRVLGVLACLVGSAAVQAQQSLGDLTGAWQLFLDDVAISTRSNVNRTYHAFEKYAGNPVLTPTKAWEDSIVYIYGTVLPAETGGGYRMWYHTMRPEDTANDGSNILYATSPDGITWTKPNLFINTWHGSNANNMVFDRPTISGLTSVMHTPFDTDPNRAYHLFNYESPGYFSAWSADGVHTTDVPGNPVITGVGDVGMASYDPHTQQYIAYVKINTTVNGLQRRSVARCTSSDTITWSAPQLVLEPDTYDDRWVPAGTVQRAHFYGLCAFAYESMYVGILWIFRATDVDGYYIGPVYAEIVSSRDGINWMREEGTRPAALALGSAGAWDDGQLYTAIAPVHKDGKLAIYYGACDNVHGYATKQLNCNIGLATLRKDGFASLDAGTTTGTVTTQNLTGAEGQLHVNYQNNGGWLKVEVLDASNNVLPGYAQADCIPLQGDSIDQIVGWNDHADLPVGVSPIRLRFVLQNASLYSYKTAPPIVDPPFIVQQPADRSVVSGATTSFSVQATGATPLAYQWRRNGADLVEGGHYTGTAAPTLLVSNATATQAGQYTCVVENAYGTATSDPATLSLAVVQFFGLGAGTTVSGVTASGAAVCGTSNNHAFIWTSAGGLKDLGAPAGATTSSATGVGSYNGSVVVSVNSNAASAKARRWEGNTDGIGAFTSLPLLNGTLEWTTYGLGTNGTSDLWICGSSTSGGDGGGRRAARYSRAANATSSYALPVNGHDNSDFIAVADNGYCGGQYQYKGTAPGGGARNAMIYLNAGSCAPLNTLLGALSTTNEAIVKAMSRDGLVPGGWSYYSGGGAYQKPCLWINSTPTAIPFLAGGDADNFGDVLALNGDGSLAGGYSYHKGTPDGPREAFIWDAAAGTRSYQTVLTGAYGLNLTGWNLQEIRGMSADGTTIIGNGLHDGILEGWVVTYVPVAPDETPIITAHPQPQTLCPGGTATFAVEATGDGPLTYQWQLNDTDVTDGAHYAGATTSALSVLDVDASVAGSYRCVVSNDAGSTNSNTAALALKLTGPFDLDHDCDIDLADFTLLTVCITGPAYSGPPPAGCTQAQFDRVDVDHDGDVDQIDFGVFQRCYSGPDAPLDAACAD